MLSRLTNKQLGALYDHVSRTIDDLDKGYSDASDMARGTCHTLRALGIFPDADIERWSDSTPMIMARHEMLTSALAMMAGEIDRR